MDTRRIEINGHSQIETLKVYILQKLRIINYKKTHLDEFDSRLKSYLQRNKNQKIELILNNTKFKNDLKLKNRGSIPYPENYNVGNPLNRWIHGNTPLSQEESRIREEKTKRDIKETILNFNKFFEWLEILGEGQIKIVKKD